MDRTGWLVVGTAAAALVFGAGSGMFGPVPMVALLGLGGLALASTRLREPWRGEQDAWPAPVQGPLPFVVTAGRPPASDRAVAGALGRVEARMLLASAAFVTGVGFCVLQVVLFGVVWKKEFSGHVADMLELATIMAHPLAGMTILAVHRARTRGRRDGAEELFEACPTSPHVRNAAHLRTAWLPAAVVVAFACTLSTLLHAGGGAGWGSIGGRQVAHVAGAALLPVGAVALGVAIARSVPVTLAPVLAVVAIGLASVQLSTSGERSTDASRQLSTWLTGTDSNLDIRFTAPRWLAHHLWVLALVAIVVVLALLRDMPHPRRGTAVLAGLALVAGGAGYAATRPVDPADARRIASLVADPASHQTCIDGGVPVCTYEGDGALAREYRSHVRSVVAALPRGALAGVRVRQGAKIERRELDPAVVALLPPTVDDGALPFDMLDSAGARQSARFWLALRGMRIVGAEPPERPVDLAGQARGVVAIWAATRGLDDREARLMSSTGGDDGSSRPWPDPCLAGPAPVQWALTDLAAARLIQALPDADVSAVVHSRWNEIVDPATTTDALLVLLGRAPLGRPGAGRTPVPTSC